jgi:Zn-dependent protease with chaperone function
MSDAPQERLARPAHVRLAFVIIEGYVYLALIVAIFLAASGFLVWGILTLRPFIALITILVGVPVAATTARALRALWFVFPEPKGIHVGPQFGGRFYREVDEIAKRVGSPRIHRIVVTGAYNAAAIQMPRAGVFWPRNTLAVGYPLLATLSVDQMRAVIAHELGHMTHAHGRFASWVHRTRLSWTRLLDVLERHQSVPAHVYLLFRFYVPRLYAVSASVSREQERLADRLASEVAGREATAQALIAIAAGQHLVADRVWPHPPFPFAQLGPDLWEGVDDRAELLEHLLDDTAGTDTHPVLRERLAALAQQPRWPGPVQVTAVDHFFGSQKRELAAALDKRWQDGPGRKWAKERDAIRTRTERLAQLAALTSPTPEEVFERGALIEEEGDTDAALALYRLAQQHGHAEAGLAAGRVLLDRDDSSGLALIDAAMAAKPDLIESGSRIAGEFLQHRGRLVDAYHYERRRILQKANASMTERDRSR